jgi:hypothetical protein
MTLSCDDSPWKFAAFVLFVVWDWHCELWNLHVLYTTLSVGPSDKSNTVSCSRSVGSDPFSVAWMAFRHATFSTLNVKLKNQYVDSLHVICVNIIHYLLIFRFKDDKIYIGEMWRNYCSLEGFVGIIWSNYIEVMRDLESCINATFIICNVRKLGLRYFPLYSNPIIQDIPGNNWFIWPCA